MVRMSLVNLYLHGFSDPHIFEYDTLSSEDRWDETFDVVLANPPFMSPKGGIRPHKKFSITSNRSEVLFVDYIAEHLNPNGKAGIIVPEGIIFQSGKAYKELRKMLVDNYLYAVVSLPAGVFNPYSGVKTSILLMDKALAKKNNDILFVKIENDGYSLGAQRTPIKGGQLEEVIQTLADYKNHIVNSQPFENTTLAHAVSKETIGKSGDYNLSGERYKIVKILSTDFECTKLGEICDLYGGGTPSKADNEFWLNGTIKWLSAKHIDNNGNIIGNELITEEAVKNSSTKIAPPDSLIFITRVSVGKYAYSTDYYAINQDLTVVIPKDDKRLLPRYLYSIASKIATIIDKQAVGIGVRGITRSQLSEIVIPLPPLSVQEEIVAEIESYQKIIDGAKMVVDHYKPRIEMDPSWEMVELGDIAKPEYGFTEKAKDEGNTRFIRITDISSEGKLISTDAKFINLTNEAKKSLLKKNDILLARTGATYGKTMIFQEDYSAVFASFLMRLNFTTDKINPKYYWIFSQSESYVNQAASLMTGGGQPQFNGNAVVKIKLPLPPLEIQQQIVSQIEKEQALVNANKELIAIYEQKIKDRIAKVWGN
jgi:type I restriction enzyme M protein